MYSSNIGESKLIPLILEINFLSNKFNNKVFSYDKTMIVIFLQFLLKIEKIFNLMNVFLIKEENFSSLLKLCMYIC